jgi:hypothetical protein
LPAVDGTAVASVPVSAGRVGVNYLARDDSLSFVNEGKSGISKVLMRNQLKAPVFGMVTPDSGRAGHTDRRLAGVTDLNAAELPRQGRRRAATARPAAMCWSRGSRG